MKILTSAVTNLAFFPKQEAVAHILDRGLICHRACREVEAMDTMEAKIITFIQIAYLADRTEPLDVPSVMKQYEKFDVTWLNLSSPCS